MKKEVKLGYTLREETFAEECFAISRFLEKIAKFFSREIFLMHKSRKFILAKKLRKKIKLARVKKSKNLKKICAKTD